ncbi:hypothetical protein O6H91_17G056700 [Diphasiastrum complanatum]|uniref:Uncharacterized protein n=1 Tax=Diphasiastrum complanatum TaxID=34168 RepID=A0ACC2B728_DIPCM|nr:hypothetical protein O6H91_17G056700 [Diphasiastrum complanatum]
MGRARSGVVAAQKSTDTSPLLPCKDNDLLLGNQLSSVRKTFGNIAMSLVGAGMLGLPYAFKRAGWLAGSIALIVVAMATYYSLKLLVDARKKVEDDGEAEVATYSDLSYHAYGDRGRIAVDGLIFLSQGGTCIAILIFIGENLPSLFSTLTITSHPAAGIADAKTARSRIGLAGKDTYIFMAFVLQLGMAGINSLTRLAPFSMLGTLANVLAMAVVMREYVVEIISGGGIKPVEAFTDLSGLPFAVGVGIYALSCTVLLIPIQSSMQNQPKFEGVLALAMSSVTTLYVNFALLGFLAFGSQTRDIITLNLHKSLETSMVQAAQCLGLFFSFRLNIHPVYEMIERRLSHGKPSMFMRCSLLVVTCCVAVVVPNFGDFISLVGSSVSCTLGFIFPALFHLRLFGELSWPAKSLDYGFIAFGIIFGLWGSATSISKLAGF